MAIPVGTGIKIPGTEVVMETAGPALTNGSFHTCNDATFATAEVEGLSFARFEFDNAGSFFSAAPTAGAVINVYDKPFNSDANQAPQIDATYKKNFIGSFEVDVADAQQYLMFEGPINYYGGDFVVEWVDGGAGTAQLELNWILRVIPFGFGPSS